MNLFFQFLTQTQTREGINLVRILENILNTQTLRGHAIILAQGTSYRINFPRMQVLYERIANRQFNQLNIVSNWKKEESLCLGGTCARITCFNAVLTPSPTSDIWLPCKKWVMAVDGAVGEQWENAKKKEDIVHFYRIKKQPLILEVSIQVSTNNSSNVVLDKCAHWLAGCLPASLEKLHLFGYCDPVNPIYIANLKSRVLLLERYKVMMNVRPSGYAKLGAKLEALHSLIIGTKRVCNGVRSALGVQAKLINAEHLKNLAFLKLAMPIDRALVTREVNRWMIKGN